MTLSRLWLLTLIFLGLNAHSAFAPPTLKGQLNDTANILTPQQRITLTQQLTATNQANSNQIVILTIPHLQGYTIEEAALTTARQWGIGQKDNDNGILLLLAQKERKIRIEVGYGLEGALTDAIASNIIQQRILPPFKKNQFAQGFSAGVKAIHSAIKGDYKITRRNQKKTTQSPALYLILLPLLLIGSVLSPFRRRRFGSHRYGYSGLSTRHSGFGSRLGGGFGGGGGSFGGGGASGSW